MKHNLEIKFTPNKNWSMIIFFNNQMINNLDIIPENFSFDFDIENYNVLMCIFVKNHFEKDGFKILDVKYNHISIGNTIYNTEFFSSHPQYSKLTPCMDINLSGSWFLRFNKDFGNEIIRRYVNG